jgi:ribose transport system substrate-binding protein
VSIAIALSLVPAARAKDCIGVVPAGGGYAFWKFVEAGARQAGKELNTEIYFRGPADEADIYAQAVIIDSVLEQSCKGLVLAPNAPERASQVAALKAKGIPTVYIDRDPGGADVVGVVATDNFSAGRLAGEQMAKALGGHGNVALLRLKRGTISTDERERGFVEGATKGGLTIALDVYLGTKVGDARINARRELEAYRGQLDGIFTPNEFTTLATLVVLQEMNRAGKAVHIGFDASERLVNAVRSGEIAGLVLQRPFDMGYQGTLMAYRKIHGQPIPARTIDTGVEFVTKANMNRPEFSALLNPR